MVVKLLLVVGLVLLFGFGFVVHVLWILVLLALGVWVLRAAVRPRRLRWLRHLPW